MIFICAIIPLSCVAVALSFGGATAAFSLIQVLIYLPLFAKVGNINRFRVLLIPICITSVIMRFLSIYTATNGSLGVYGSLFLVVACIALSGWAAYNGDSAMYSSIPLFFISVILALYVVAVSFSEPLREPFAAPSVLERVSALICPLSSCVAFSALAQFPPIKRYKGALVGLLVCAVFLLFQSADAEFGFISVPLAIVMSALEIKTVKSVILKPKTE